MKKVALSLLAFVLVGALAVAQDAPTLKLSGYLNTGVEVIGAGSAARSALYGDDAGNYWGRFQIVGAYGTDTNGVNWRLRTANDATAPTISYAYAWSKFAEGLVTVKAGKVDDGTFETAGDIGDDFVDGNGLVAIVTPVPGLNVGATWILPSSDPTASSTPLSYAFSGAFTSDKLFKAEAGGKIVDSKFTEAVVGVGILAVDKLTLSADAHLSDLAVSGANSFAKVSQVVSYAVTDALSAGVVAYEYIWGSDIKNAKGDAKLGFNVKPNVTYTVDPVIAVGAEFKYNQGPNPDFKANLNDVSWLNIKPSATFTLSPAAKIITSYELVYSLDKDKFPISVADSGTQAVGHAVKVDFRYNF